MEYINLPSVKIPVSRMIMGGSSAPMRRGEDCEELLSAAFDAGINFFDTARGYGKSEQVLGEWLLQKGVREQVVVQTKGALHGLLGNNRVKAGCIRADLKKSLEALHCDYLDIYLLHRDDPKTDVGWIVELMNEFCAEGKVRAYGVSNWNHIRMDLANEYAYKHGLRPIEFSQPHFGLCEAGRFSWIGCLSVTGQKNALARAWYARKGMPLEAYSPLCGGLLSGKVRSDDLKTSKDAMSFAMRRTFLHFELREDNVERLRRTEEIAKQTGCSVAQLALAWVLKQNERNFVLLGSSRKETLLKSVAAAEISLTDEQAAYMDLKRNSL